MAYLTYSAITQNDLYNLSFKQIAEMFNRSLETMEYFEYTNDAYVRGSTYNHLVASFPNLRFNIHNFSYGKFYIEFEDTIKEYHGRFKNIKDLAPNYSGYFEACFSISAEKLDKLEKISETKNAYLYCNKDPNAKKISVIKYLGNETDIKISIAFLEFADKKDVNNLNIGVSGWSTDHASVKDIHMNYDTPLKMLQYSLDLYDKRIKENIYNTYILELFYSYSHGKKDALIKSLDDFIFQRNLSSCSDMLEALKDSIVLMVLHYGYIIDRDLIWDKVTHKRLDGSL